MARSKSKQRRMKSIRKIKHRMHKKALKQRVAEQKAQKAAS